jgi:hypothetical protein
MKVASVRRRTNANIASIAIGDGGAGTYPLNNVARICAPHLLKPVALPAIVQIETFFLCARELDRRIVLRSVLYCVTGNVQIDSLV